MSSIVVTGSAGFIGFHLCRRLLRQGHQVIGIDNFNDYYAPTLKKARNDHLKSVESFVSIEMDLADRSTIESTLKDHQFELICHLAAQPGVRYSLVNPYAYEIANCAAFLNVIELARQKPVARFVYASSSSVYGGNTKMPYSEDDPVNTPISLYAATKRANELMAYTYHHLYGLQTIGLRFFTVYGEWGRPDMAYWSFLENILNDDTIRVFNMGKNSRDFTYIEDIVDGIVASLFTPDLEGYEIINLGNNHPVDVLTFITILEQLTAKSAKKEMSPAQPGDVVSTFADISRAQKKLGFHPKTDISEGLSRFVRWYLSEEKITHAVRLYRRYQRI